MFLGLLNNARRLQTNQPIGNPVGGRGTFLVAHEKQTSLRDALIGLQ